LPHIFEHSYRADDSQAQHETPGGLGLALTKWVVVQHRGAIHVTSAPDEGAVFTITLPSLTLSEREFSQIRQLANRAAKPVLKD